MTSTGHFTESQIAGIDAALTRFERSEILRRRLEAEQLLDLAAALRTAVGDRAAPSASKELAYRSLRFELATMLHASESAAERLLDTAYSAQSDFAESLESLRRGEISLAHLRVITSEGAPLTAGNTGATAKRRAAYENAVLGVAREESPNRLRPIARRLAAAQHESEREARHAEAVRRRQVRVTEAGDGMADLNAYLPAEEAHAIFNRLTRIAKDEVANRSPVAAEPRSVDERRADVLRDLLLGVPGDTQAAASRIRGQIQVVVPIAALDDPEARAAAAEGTGTGIVAGAGIGITVAELIGHGPIDSGTARRLAGDAEAWEVVRVSPSGEVLSVDRRRPTPEMRRRLAARDLHCRAPGCTVAAYRCDIDHTVDVAFGGPTSTDNLAHLCRGHHMVKHHTDWRVRQSPDGTLEWTSPTGRRHADRPPSRVRFVRAA